MTIIVRHLPWRGIRGLALLWTREHVVTGAVKGSVSLTVGAQAPQNPQTNDLWVNTN